MTKPNALQDSKVPLESLRSQVCLSSFTVKYVSCTLNIGYFILGLMSYHGAYPRYTSIKGLHSQTWEMLHMLNTIWIFTVYFRKLSFLINPAGKKSAELSLNQYFPNLFLHGSFFHWYILTVHKLLQGIYMGYIKCAGDALFNLKMQLITGLPSVDELVFTICYRKTETPTSEFLFEMYSMICWLTIFLRKKI